MEKRTRTVQSSLFLTYSLIIVILLGVFVTFFYFWVSNLLKNKAFDTIASLSASTSEKLDIEIRKMNDVSMNVSYSSAVKDRFMTYISNPYKPSGVLDENWEKTERTNNTKELIDILFAIIGPNRPVQQIYLYDFNGKVFGTGTDNRQQDISVQEKPWFPVVMKNYGKKCITVPLKDEELSKFVKHIGSPYFISLCRIYFDDYNAPRGIVEVKQYYDEIFRDIDKSMRSNNENTNIYVYDAGGTLIYPLKENASEKDAYYFKLGKTTQDHTSPLSASNPFTGEKELLGIRHSDFSGWTTVAVVSENKLLAPIFAFARILVLVAAIILLLALVFSFFAAKKITVPIARLNRAIRAFNLESPVPEIPAEPASDLNELENLNQTFHTMNIKLKNSHNELLLAHQHEMQARMLALQSQMNPHFLYNTLATISVMAEESMDKQIVEMCANVSDMLRYISSDKSPLVELGSELDYTEKYLSCMKFRYGGKFSYSLELEEDMKDIKIPKLVIQPLVENALKYGTRREPPWTVRICGHRTNTYWQISVQDNGTGFDPERLEQIRQTIEEIDRNGLLPSLELEGMGLLNIYIRLKLAYKNQTIFQIGDYVSGGAIVFIGGSI